MPALGEMVQKLWRVMRPGPAVLMYQPIAEPAAAPWELAVSPAHFYDQRASLKHKRTVLQASLPKVRAAGMKA